MPWLVTGLWNHSDTSLMFYIRLCGGWSKKKFGDIFTSLIHSFSLMLMLSSHHIKQVTWDVIEFISFWGNGEIPVISDDWQPWKLNKVDCLADVSYPAQVKPDRWDATETNAYFSFGPAVAFQRINTKGFNVLWTPWERRGTQEAQCAQSSEDKAGVRCGEVLGPVQAPKNQADTFCSVTDLSVTQEYSFSI